MNDKRLLIRLGIKSAVNPMDTRAFHAFIEQIGKCQNLETHDGTVDDYPWEVARSLKATIFEYRNSKVELDKRLHMLETLV